MTMINLRSTMFAFLQILLLSQSSSSLVIPSKRHQHTRVTTQLDLSAPLLDGNSSPLFRGNSSPEHPTNALAKLGNAIVSLFRHKKNVDDGIISPQKLERQELDVPIRGLGESITRSVHHELAEEGRKAKPLLKEAQHRIKQDKDLKAVLGEPIHIRPVFSGSTATSIINGKQTRHIVDEFEVVGSKRSGVGILQADKYAKGHLLDLRVDVGGIHYDVDV